MAEVGEGLTAREQSLENGQNRRGRRGTRRRRTIRGRLLLSYILVSVVPVIIIAITGVLFAWRSGRDRVIEQVNAVADIQAARAESWAVTLRDGLDRALRERDAILYAQFLLRPRVTGTDAGDTYSNLRTDLMVNWTAYVAEDPLFDAIALVDLDGQVLVSTDERYEGQRLGSEVVSDAASSFRIRFAWSGLAVDPSSVLATSAVQAEDGEVLGILVGRAPLLSFENVLGSQLGETGEAYLVDEQSGLTLTPVWVTDRNAEVPLVLEWADSQAQDGAGTYSNYLGVSVIGAYRSVPDLGTVLMVEQDQNEAFQAVTTMLVANSSIALFVGIVSVFVSLAITRSIADPLAELGVTSERIAGGDLTSVVSESGAEEIRTLAVSFNSMTAQLREVIDGLESRVAERTLDLERRSTYAEAASEVGRAASAILDPERLYRVTVDLVRERLELLYVGLYLVEESEQWAVLRAGAGSSDENLIVNEHRVRLGQGTVGWAISNGRSRIASRPVGEGEEDELAQGRARSEAALPLRSRGQVLGALTVKSDQPGAFDQDLLLVLQTMADQVAVAMDNARLFGESQSALYAAQRASGDLSREAWSNVLRARTELSYRGTEQGVTQVGHVWHPEMERASEEGVPVIERRDEGQSLAVPIVLHGDVIGVLDTFKPNEKGTWTLEQVALVEQIVEQLSQSLENARLYEETQRRGIREQQLREIGTRMQSTVDLDAILRVAVEDLARALEVPSAFVQLYEGRRRDEE